MIAIVAEHKVFTLRDDQLAISCKALQLLPPSWIDVGIGVDPGREVIAERVWGGGLESSIGLIKHCAVHSDATVFDAYAIARDPNHALDQDDFVWDAYLWVDDVDFLYQRFSKAGVKIVRPMCDQEYNMREFDILDCNGYRLCFGQDIL